MPGYIVLREYPSSSDPGKYYQVRRGGDGILYCSSREGKICFPWLGSRNKLRAAGREGVEPAQCKHTREYVAETGASYGPQYATPLPSAAPPSFAKNPKPAFALGKPAPKAKQAQAPTAAGSAPAPANWREVLLAERSAASKLTPAAALAEFDREVRGRFLDVDLGAPAPGAAIGAAARAVDVE